MYNQSPDPARERSTDSWIDVSSRSSNPSSASVAEDIVANSIRIRRDVNARRRGRPAEENLLRIDFQPRHSSVGGSSQEEYEESESESDRIMTSSNEGIHSSPSESDLPGRAGAARDAKAEQEHDEDESRTAIGVPSDQACFTPQPNAFTHPPSSSRYRSSVPGSYFPASSRPTMASRQSSSGHGQRPGHSPFNTISPSHLPDHDAALRASLNTLLSCAAAARSLPKGLGATSRTAPVPSTARVEPSSLRMVPESVALGLERPSLQTRRVSSTPSSSNRAASPATEARDAPGSDHVKRKATRSSSKDRQRLAKKPRRALVDESISPTLLTWVVSAGVLVLVSALSFSAGYKVGRETARLDTGIGAGEGGSCAKEAGRTGLGLRRLRWSDAASAVTA